MLSQGPTGLLSQITKSVNLPSSSNTVMLPDCLQNDSDDEEFGGFTLSEVVMESDDNKTNFDEFYDLFGESDYNEEENEFEGFTVEEMSVSIVLFY